MAYIDDIRDKVIKKSRFDKINYMIDAPSSDEIDAAIYFAVDEINSYPPLTNHKFEDYESLDPRYQFVLINCSAKNVIDTLIFDWVANGLDASIGDFTLESKLGDYNTLYDRLANDCKDTITRLKPAENMKATVLDFPELGKPSVNGYTRSNIACRFSKATRGRR